MGEYTCVEHLKAAIFEVSWLENTEESLGHIPEQDGDESHTNTQWWHPGRSGDLLPDDSVLYLNEYLTMHATVGHQTRYEILYRLIHGGVMSPKELEEAIDLDDNTLYYHLNKLVDVGLVEKRQRTERGQEGLYTYYRAAVFGDVTLTEGIDERIRDFSIFLFCG